MFGKFPPLLSEVEIDLPNSHIVGCYGQPMALVCFLTAPSGPPTHMQANERLSHTFRHVPLFKNTKKEKTAKAALSFHLARFLPVNFNVHTWSAHFVPMVEAVALVHVEARPARHALAFAETFVTHLVTHTVRVGRHR